MSATIKIATKFYARLISGYTVFFLSTLAFGLLLNKFIETAFIIVGYFATRFAVPKIKHFNTTQKCISITTMTFMFAIAVLCIPKHISIIWSICVGTCIPLIMYAESLLFDKKKYDYDNLVSFYETAIAPKPFSVDTCNETELLERCKELRLSEENTNLAIEFFIKKTKQSILADRLCIDELSIATRKYRLKQKLNKDI